MVIRREGRQLFRLPRSWQSITLALALSLGMVGCAGDQEQQMEEPVQTAEGQEGEEWSEQDEDSGDQQSWDDQQGDDELYVDEDTQLDDGADDQWAEQSSEDSYDEQYSNQDESVDDTVSQFIAEDANESTMADDSALAAEFTEEEPVAMEDAGMMTEEPAADAGWSSTNTTTASAATSGDGSYVVEDGDTLAIISRKLYGSTGHWAELAANNGLSAPYTIYPGQALSYNATPSHSHSNVASHSHSHSGHSHHNSSNWRQHVGNVDLNAATETVTVQRGDTLWGLAGRHLGSNYKWPVIMAFNEGSISHPDRITVGQRLRYPSNNAVASTSNYQEAPVQPAAVMDDEEVAVEEEVELEEPAMEEEVVEEEEVVIDEDEYDEEEDVDMEEEESY